MTIAKEAVCKKNATKSPNIQDGALVEIASGIDRLKFPTAVSNSFDLFWSNPDSPCSDCWARKKNASLTQCSYNELSFCSNLFQSMKKYWKHMKNSLKKARNWKFNFIFSASYDLLLLLLKNKFHGFVNLKKNALKIDSVPSVIKVFLTKQTIQWQNFLTESSEAKSKNQTLHAYIQLPY